MTKMKIVLGQCKDCGHDVLLKEKDVILKEPETSYWREATCLWCGCVFSTEDYKWAQPVFSKTLNPGLLVVGAEQEL